MIHGSPKFSGLAIGELTLNKLGPTLKLEAKAAFVDPKTGSTHGWTTGSQWSPTTIAKLGELLALMEMDMGRAHFEGGGVPLEGAIVGTPGPQQGRLTPMGGLSEHVVGVDAESI